MGTCGSRVCVSILLNYGDCHTVCVILLKTSDGHVSLFCLKCEADTTAYCKGGQQITPLRAVAPS